MKFFFSCDWGTSTFRLRLVDAENASVLSELKTDHGIAIVYKRWKQAKQDDKSRSAFYQTYLFEQIKKLSGIVSDPVARVIISGMASSSIGMMELPYKNLPFDCNGTDMLIRHLQKDEVTPYEILIISGVKSEVDVIRGEETMLVGCNILPGDLEQLFIFPGTHSKHLSVKNGLVTDIKTFMTGELFELLSKKSILSASVKEGIDDDMTGGQNFVDGVMEGAATNLMNSIFHVRTNQLFRKISLQENYYFLSGLLIGHELKDIAQNKCGSITLVCGEGLQKAYTQAFDILGLNDMLQYKNADHALVNGHCKIMQQFK